jgi:hypothetical protein
MDLVTVTGALAFGTFLLAVATAVMAWHTRRSAGAAVEAVQLQRREIVVFEQQTKLAQDQFEASRSAARPLLDISVAGFDGGARPSGFVDYIGGSEPAHDVELWIKATGGFFGARCPNLLPAKSRYTFVLEQHISDEVFARQPFPEFTKAPGLQTGEFFAGVTWKSLDDTPGRYRYRQRTDGTRDENPEVMVTRELPLLPADGGL